jgi:hypothetical protein
MGGPIGRRAFISYRGRYYGQVRPVGNWLRGGGLIDDVSYVQPQALAADYELLLPFEVFELIMTIWQRMEKCDSFVFLNTPDYLASIWTTLEVIGWRVMSRAPIAYAVALDPAGYRCDPTGVVPMPAPEKRLWIRLRAHLEPMGAVSRSHLLIPNRGGRFATDHYLLACRVCGEYSLLPKRPTERAAKRGEVVTCAQPTCVARHRMGKVGRFNGIRYRVPIVAEPLTDRRAPSMRSLQVDELMQLYVDGRHPPARIPVAAG